MWPAFLPGMRSPRRLVLIVLAGVAITARPSLATETPLEPAPEGGPAQEKSPGLALGLSIALPLAGYGMIAAASLPPGDIQTWQKVTMGAGIAMALVGPSGGHLYLGSYRRAALFTAGRLALTGLAAIAFSEGVSHSDTSESSYDSMKSEAAAVGVALCGAGIVALSIWESIDSYGMAKEMNRAPGRTLALSPMMASSREGVSLAGLSLAGTF